MMVLSIAFILAVTIFTIQAQTLPGLNIDRNTITVSGFSGGAYFANQFHVAFSANLSGMATWSGGPNICLADPNCLSDPAQIDVNRLVNITRNLANNGDIDDLKNIASSRVYIFQGSEDVVVNPASAQPIKDYYVSLGSQAVAMQTSIPASHAISSDYYGSICGLSDHRIFIENCNFDSVFHALNHLYEDELVYASSIADTSYLSFFDQNDFFENQDAYAANLGEKGLVFIPPACQGFAYCKLHVHFHGCGIYYNSVGTDFITNSGFLDTAEANNIVVLFPQLTSTPFGSDSGCFNWYGYLNDEENYEYVTKTARQMKGLFAMIKKVSRL